MCDLSKVGRLQKSGTTCNQINQSCLLSLPGHPAPSGPSAAIDELPGQQPHTLSLQSIDGGLPEEYTEISSHCFGRSSTVCPNYTNCVTPTF